jgi:hypothetical protein
MSENDKNEIPFPTQTYSRSVRLEDFFDTDDDVNKNSKNNNYNYNKYDNSISKNQQEFGHRKRIKP